MPELPEVETIVKELQAADLIGKKIVETQIFWHRSIAVPDVKQFCSKIVGQKIDKISRRGKFLVFTLTHDTLLIHLRMTGKFTLSKETQVDLAHERLFIRFDDGRILHYQDQRKFGKWYLVSCADDKLQELGIEPLSSEFTYEAFKAILQGHRVQAKPFLLNQKFIVGLGNIYADEALWMAKIHPKRQIDNLKPPEIKALFQAIPKVLQQGIRNMGTTLGSKNANYFSVSGRRGSNQHKLNVFRREGLPCPRCKTKIVKMIVAQRGTHICPHCQKILPKIVSSQ